MIKQLAHVCIGAKNLAETEQFYCNVLGLEKKFVFDKAGKEVGFYLALGGNSFIEVFADSEASEANKEQRPLLKHFCLEVEDIDTVISAVRDKGWMISDKKFGLDNAWQAWINDPSGVAIELHQYTPESSQLTGKDCLVDW
jgi:catechol 2,3-dioxygenase-like lactoylglutathione lyase family enzyme